ncbi:WXG100 family type VII secretion target [Mycobacterium sp. PSTR-4-N]|nr:WXG100 family type VII secretion target [Mycobacterium sp. PSTR-4-N]
MLPSRSRLQGWRPDSMSAAAAALSKAGESVYTAIRDLDDGVDRMPAAEAWSGASHKAAAAMFTRATDKASTFKNYADAVSRALSDGAGTIGTAAPRW